MFGIAPDQNRTDTRSLEGYCSTIELQAQEKEKYAPLPFSLQERTKRAIHKRNGSK